VAKRRRPHKFRLGCRRNPQIQAIIIVNGNTRHRAIILLCTPSNCTLIFGVLSRMTRLCFLKVIRAPCFDSTELDPTHRTIDLCDEWGTGFFLDGCGWRLLSWCGVMDALFIAAGSCYIRGMKKIILAALLLTVLATPAFAAKHHHHHHHHHAAAHAHA
jgi:hypothetical protein